MPVAIVTLPGVVPAIIQQNSATELDQSVRSLPACPPGVADVRSWLQTLPAPSGWFDTIDDAQDYVERTNRERDAKLMKAAIAHLGREGGKVSQSAMAKALGLADAQNDGSSVRKVLLAKHGLTGTARRALAYLVKYGPMTEQEQEEILNGLGNGAWRTVQHDDIRRLS